MVEISDNGMRCQQKGGGEVETTEWGANKEGGGEVERRGGDENGWVCVKEKMGREKEERRRKGAWEEREFVFK